jgi:hypothetical protein
MPPVPFWPETDDIMMERFVFSLICRKLLGDRVVIGKVATISNVGT